MNDEERALLHRQQAKSRERYRKVQERSLRGDPARAKAVRQAWQPVLDWVRGK